MKKFVVYLLVIVLAVSLGFAVFYLVKDDEVISISNASIYTDVNKEFSIDYKHENKKSYTTIDISSSNEDVVKHKAENTFTAISGGVARVNFRTNNAKFRNLWCDVIVGDGTETSPYYISSVEQLAAIGRGEKISDGVFAGSESYPDYASNKCYKLVADIDAKSINDGYWIPLANFSGIFDGNGFTIYNVNIDYEAYTNTVKDKPDYNPNLHTTKNVGLFQTIESTGKVFNLKLDNYRANGVYDNFGTVAAINYGTIERIEVKNAYLSVETNETFGGIVAVNETTDKGSGADYERFIARIDRCSINLTLGKKRIFKNDEFVENVIGNTGIIGGLVGQNIGGTIVYSYTDGEVNFLSDEITPIVYGGLIGYNTYKELPNHGGAHTSKYQGANIKDCYSNIKINMASVLANDDTKIAGGIARNVDFTSGIYDNNVNNEIVQSYIIGVYYNSANLNAEQEGMTKQFNGIAEFKYGTKTITYTEDPLMPIVVGLKGDEMLDAGKFVSHYTSDIEFNDKGESEGVKPQKVSWLFDTVWAKDPTSMPYLNYQLVYIPNDFNTVGTPVISSGVYKYINADVEYPITIVSGNNKRINIEVGEEYQLKVNPTGLVLNWKSNNEAVVTVDSVTGEIKGVSQGSASITVTTKNGKFSDYIDVYVNDISYAINNVISEVTLTVDEVRNIGANVTVTPDTAIKYTSLNPEIATVNATTGVVTAVSIGETNIEIKAGNTVKYTKVIVVSSTSSVKPVNIVLENSVINHSYTGSPITGKIVILSATYQGIDIKEGLTFEFTSTESNILTVDNNGNYTVRGTGSASVYVTVTKAGYSGLAQVFFNIGSSENVGILKDSYNINVGDSIIIETTGTDLIKDISWSSNNTNKVTVNDRGVATGIATGTASIYATILKTDGTYVYDRCDITVVGQVTTPIITLNTYSESVYVGDVVSVVASLNIEAELVWDIKLSSDDVAGITEVSNKERRIEMLKAGSVAITVFCGTYSKTCTIVAVDKMTYVKEIYTVKQLDNVRNFLDRDFELCANLDLSGLVWEPIGTEAKPFTGTFVSRKANSYEFFSISGINANSVYSGLFGYTNNAHIQNVEVKNSTIAGTIAAGSIIGYAKNTSISGCYAENNTITSVNAGGLVGKMSNGTTLYNSKVIDCAVTTVSTNAANIGGIVGYMAANCTVNNVDVTNRNKYINITSGSHGNAGGVAGYSAGRIIYARVIAKVTAGNKDNDYAGGIVGYTNGKVDNSQISNSNIEGYYAGGIGGSINNDRVVSIEFEVTNKGYRREDIKSISAYSADVYVVAVKDTVNVKGQEVGGLFGIVNSGVISNCYTRAHLSGYSKSSFVSGFASQIKSSGFVKEGGKGQVGIVEYCYSACTFSGSCYDFAISQSVFHDNVKNRTYGYVFNFVFDGDLADDTDFLSGLMFNGDPSEAEKSTSEMKSKETYTNKGFSATNWMFGSDYPKLIIEG